MCKNPVSQNPVSGCVGKIVTHLVLREWVIDDVDSKNKKVWNSFASRILPGGVLPGEKSLLRETPPR